MANMQKEPRTKTRSRQTELHPRWMALLADHVTAWQQTQRDLGRPSSLDELGRQLAERVERPEPWRDASVSRFLDGSIVTADMSAAFEVFFSLPRAVWPASCPEEAQWYAAGRDLLEADPALFRRLLVYAEESARHARQVRRAKDDLGMD